MIDSNEYARKATRLAGYDYSQAGFYFVTICTHGRKCCLGEVIDWEMALSEWGEVVQEVWGALPKHYWHVYLDEFIIMPNHIHGIIQLIDEKPNPGRGGFLNPPLQQRHGLSEIVRGFKTWSVRRINQIRNTPGVKFWQRSFYDRIIRDERDLDIIRTYIHNNALKWEDDRDNP
jgi:REP element-mobilizing transposase RayT